MNFIGATLLLILKDEELAFWIFYAMMKRLDMEPMYLPGVPELHIKNYEMSHLIRAKVPKLFNHLKHIQMTTDYFTSKWIMTVFANSMPFHTIPYIFDNLLLDGWSSIYRIGIAILRQIEQQFTRDDKLVKSHKQVEDDFIRYASILTMTVLSV